MSLRKMFEDLFAKEVDPKHVDSPGFRDGLKKLPVVFAGAAAACLAGGNKADGKERITELLATLQSMLGDADPKSQGHKIFNMVHDRSANIHRITLKSKKKIIYSYGDGGRYLEIDGKREELSPDESGDIDNCIRTYFDHYKLRNR